MNKQQTISKTETDSVQPQSIQGDILKIAIDVHAAFFVVAYQMDGSNPKPPQRIKSKEFVGWLAKQLGKAKAVVCCYEAGPTGFWLHRRIVALGISNYVVCPTCLDSRSRGVNTDKTDAKELLSRLDRYLAGNKKAFSPVRVPTEQEEQRRLLPRQRQQLQQTRLSLASRGRSLLLLHGWRQSNNWWRPRRWQELQEQLPPWLTALLKTFHELIATVHQKILLLDKAIEARSAKERPRGLGPLSWEQIQSEVCDWSRFKNRRQIGGFAGLTGGVSGSGEQVADLSITKAGNKRLRTTLVELAWRMVLYQPDYWLVKKWSQVLCNRRTHVRARKRAIVAVARQLLVDLWKWRTGQVTAQSLGWIMAE